MSHYVVLFDHPVWFAGFGESIVSLLIWDGWMSFNGIAILAIGCSQTHTHREITWNIMEPSNELSKRLISNTCLSINLFCYRHNQQLRKYDLEIRQMNYSSFVYWHLTSLLTLVRPQGLGVIPLGNLQAASLAVGPPLSVNVVDLRSVTGTETVGSF